jgi:ATP-dependent RNA helicase RhlE
LSETTFESLGISARLCCALEAVGYQTPTPIQAQAIPLLLDGSDLLGVAQTGTGKTAAFALPLLQRLASESLRAEPKKPKALILAPTRELAIQINDELGSFSRDIGMRHGFVIGGVNKNPQIKSLARGLDVLVATPGRLLDLHSERYVDLSAVGVLVLDEADRLLDMGFIRDVKRIVAQTPKARQSVMFSATMPKEVAALAREILRDPVRVDVSPKQPTVEKIDQRVVLVDNAKKRAVLETLLREKSVSRAIVFTRTKHGANKLASQLEKAGICAEAIHGNKSQGARQKALNNFKEGKSWVLVATDIAARGIDVEGISHVINYELPHEPESYVHRIGRTARAGGAGVAWSLVDHSESKRLRAIERLIKQVPKEMSVELPDGGALTLAKTQRHEPKGHEPQGDRHSSQRDESPPRRRRTRRRRARAA